MKHINLPTWLTISRIGLTPVIVALLYFPNRIFCLVATVLYLIASASDFFDGHIARNTRQVTSIGKFLDPLADKILNCSLLIMLVQLDRVQAWVVIVIVCRELVVTGLRAIVAEDGYVMGADRFGKLKTVLQGAALAPLTLHYEWFGINLSRPGEVLLYFALVLTVFSGVNYLYNYHKFWFANHGRESGSNS
ncbi:MAG: CDP-diacylglycerol--glycerol-3-phosphate 3-phosphatidyltransferase [Deltaproteobacteria bacterium]|jgi:CDP-diacylglycerol--glycerol-3-phosphate 3-phosphatidyltransferase|nr:CDP-diacylglycerol--glycerol-3-phosphate 3-phosphatidyltransferase [Deltaproteobacteria bacterium]